MSSVSLVLHNEFDSCGTSSHLKSHFLQMSPLVSAGNATLNNLNRQGSFISNRSTTSMLSHHGILNNNNRGWSATCLRPAPPLRPCLALGSMPNTSPLRTNRKPTSYKEDALIREVIEGYCLSVKPRNAINSGELFLLTFILHETLGSHHVMN